MNNPYKPKKVYVDSIKKQTEDTFLLKIKTNILHKPGQFMQVSMPGYGECPISICSYAKDYFELCFRVVGNVTAAIAKLKKHDQIFIRGPFGNGYPMDEFKNESIVFIGGGTGAAPMRSIVEYVIDNKEKYKKSKLFFGFRSYNDILFKSDFKKYDKALDFKVSLDKKDPNWDGDVGFITNAVKDAKLNKNSIVVICGPPIMLKFIVPILYEKGITDTQIYMSLERLMFCGIGKCGHCMVNGKYVCKCGPVFRYDKGKEMID